MSDIEKVKKLREATGAGFKDCNLIKETIISAKKAAPVITEAPKSSEKKDKVEKKTKTVAELDRDKLDNKFSKKKPNKLN